MSKSRVFIFIAISFALGVMVASKFYIPRELIYALLSLTVVVFALAFFAQNHIGAYAALFLFCVFLGALRLQVSMVQSQFLDILATKQLLEGYVDEDPDIRTSLQYLKFRPLGASQNILISTTFVQQFFYGDLLAVEGKAEEVKNFSDFDYEKYLERHNVYAVMRYPKILILKSHQLNPVKELLLKTKSAFIQRINRLFKEPESSLLLGILIGAKKTLPQEIINNFNSTGTSHIIAVSGFNITIIISALASLAYVIGRRASFWLAAVTILAFVIITGASASVVRAAIMGFLLLLALNIGRQYSITPSIFLSAFIMLVFNPKILIWDVGFQLSFAATLGIVYFFPLLNSLLENFPKLFGVKTLILTTLSAIFATLPIILFDFGTLSLSAPVVNLLVLPVIPATMLFGFLSVMPVAGPGFAFVANGLLFYILRVTAFFAALPFSSVNFKISVFVFCLLIAGVFAFYFILKYFLEAKKQPVEQTFAL